MGRPTFSRNFTLLDGGALIAGAALAAVHLRLAYPRPSGGAAWVFVGGLFCWLALTAAGPFLYLIRRLAPRPGVHFPRIGDRLWVVWGLPWVGAGLIESIQHQRSPLGERLDPIYVGSLGPGLFLATGVAVPVLAARVLWGEPGSARDVGAGSWTQRVGLALSATWPIQVGVGLLLIG